MTKSDKKCPDCIDKYKRSRVLNYLYQRKHNTKTISKKGKPYDKHSYIKRVYYCEYCDTIYIKEDQKVKTIE